VTARQDLIHVLHRKLLKVQKIMKETADKKRKCVEFQVGGYAYLKLRPYRQQSLSLASYHKLSRRFYGPYQVLEKIGAIAYKLDLPPSSKIHHVFHCSLLTLHQGPIPSPSLEVPSSVVDHHPIIEPLAILDSEMDAATDPPTRFVLVQWMGLAPEDTSWERWDDLHTLYHLEDKSNLPGDGVVSNPTVSLPKRVTRKPTYLKDYVAK
jgi:hypothetical protein